MGAEQWHLKPLFASGSSVTVKLLWFPLESDGNLLKGTKHFSSGLDSAAVFRESVTGLLSLLGFKESKVSGGKCCKLRFLKVVVRSVYFWQFLRLLG